MTNNLTNLTITQAHTLLKEKKISALELTQATLARVKEQEPTIHAFVTVTEEHALQQAKQVDKDIAAGKEIKPLTGIPYTAKDAFCTKDILTTASSNILKNFIPPYSATVINKLDEVGAILIGKTNQDAFGHGSSTENSDFGITRNPINPDYVPGGSSGGAAAAVAADMGIFALAEDTGGSIRQPASFCGVTGLKVTYGRVSRYGVIAYASSLDTIGPICKNAEDAALIMETIAGHDPLDGTTPNVPVPNYYNELQNTDLSKITIGIPKEYYAEGLDPEVKQAVETAIEQYKEQGAKVKEVSLPHTKYAIAAYYLIATSETSSNLSRYDGIRYGYSDQNAENLIDTYFKSRAQGFGAEAKRRIMLGTYALSAGYYDAYYKKAMQVRTLIKQDFEKAFEEVDVLITPTSPVPPFKFGAKSHDPLSMYLMDIYTVTANLAGIPGLNIPVGKTKVDNLPIGMQILGPQFSEGKLLAVSSNTV